MDRVVVAGGGPAGCIAARSAAASGGRPTLYEEHWRIGLPVQCAGLISKTGLDSIGVNYKGSILNEIRGANIISNSSSLRVESKETKAFVINRAVFDALCAQSAEDEGAKIILGRRAPKACEGQTLIGADGVFSQTAKFYGFPAQTRIVSCYQAEFSKASLQEKHMVFVYLSKSLAPGFFGWVIPINEERVRVGLGVSQGKNPKKHFDMFARTLHQDILAGAKQESALAGFIPLSPRPKTVKGRVMLVGDAAGQVKALSGGGVYFGCKCASIAGRTAALHPEEAWRYELEWKRQFGRDLMLHRVMRNSLDVLPESGVSLLISFCRLLSAEKLLVRYGDMDSPTEIARAVKEDSVSSFSKRFNRISSIFTNVFQGYI